MPNELGAHGWYSRQDNLLAAAKLKGVDARKIEAGLKKKQEQEDRLAMAGNAPPMKHKPTVKAKRKK